MKICFFLQRRFADVGHTIICNLKESFGFNQFCAYVSVRKSYDFLKNQKEIAYTSLILDEDVHASLYKETIDYVYLKQLEKDYGIPNLWPYLCIDRILMQGQLLREYPHDEPLLSYEEMQKAIQVTSKAIIGFLEKEKPDAVVISVVGSLASLLLYHIAKKKGILTINIDLIRVKNRVGFTEDYKTFSWAKKIFEKVINGQQKIDLTKAQTFLKEFRDKPASYIKHATPEYNNQAKRIGNITFLRPDKLLRSVKWQFKSIARDIWRTHKDYTDILIWWEIWDKFKRKIRGLIGYSDLYSEVREEDFAFFCSSL